MIYYNAITKILPLFSPRRDNDEMHVRHTAQQPHHAAATTTTTPSATATTTPALPSATTHVSSH